MQNAKRFLLSFHPAGTQLGLESGEANSSNGCAGCPGAPSGANKFHRYPDHLHRPHLWAKPLQGARAGESFLPWPTVTVKSACYILYKVCFKAIILTQQAKIIIR